MFTPKSDTWHLGQGTRMVGFVTASSNLSSLATSNCSHFLPLMNARGEMHMHVYYNPTLFREVLHFMYPGWTHRSAGDKGCKFWNSTSCFQPLWKAKVLFLKNSSLTISEITSAQGIPSGTLNACRHNICRIYVRVYVTVCTALYDVYSFYASLFVVT